MHLVDFFLRAKLPKFIIIKLQVRFSLNKNFIYMYLKVCSDTSERNNFKKVKRGKNKEEIGKIICEKSVQRITRAQTYWIKCIFFTLRFSWWRLRQNRASPASCLTLPRIRRLSAIILRHSLISNLTISNHGSLFMIGIHWNIQSTDGEVLSQFA